MFRYPPCPLGPPCFSLSKNEYSREQCAHYLELSATARFKSSFLAGLGRSESVAVSITPVSVSRSPAAGIWFVRPPVADARNRTVDSSIVLVRTHDCLHHFGRRGCRVGIEIQHRAADVARGDSDCGCVVAGAECEHTTEPPVLLEGNGAQRTNQNVGRNRRTSSSSRRVVRFRAPCRRRSRKCWRRRRCHVSSASSRARRSGVRPPRPDPRRRQEVLAVRRENVRWKDHHLCASLSGRCGANLSRSGSSACSEPRGLVYPSGEMPGACRPRGRASPG